MSAQVTADYDKTVDFTKFKTYTIAGWQKDSDSLLNDIDKKTLLAALSSELASRNLTLASSDATPDIIITLYLVIKNETSISAYTDYNGGLGYGYGARWGYGMGSATTTYSENDYQVGTLVLDMYDGTTKSLLWQGVSQSTINAKANNRDKTIPKKVAALMKKYPVAASKK